MSSRFRLRVARRLRIVPLRAFVPKTAEGLLGAVKNIGMSSVVEAALRLHPQMILSGQVGGTLAARALIEGRTPRRELAIVRLREMDQD